MECFRPSAKELERITNKYLVRSQGFLLNYNGEEFPYTTNNTIFNGSIITLSRNYRITEENKEEIEAIFTENYKYFPMKEIEINNILVIEKVINTQGQIHHLPIGFDLFDHKLWFPIHNFNSPNRSSHLFNPPSELDFKKKGITMKMFIKPATQAQTGLFRNLIEYLIENNSRLIDPETNRECEFYPHGHRKYLNSEIIEDHFIFHRVYKLNNKTIYLLRKYIPFLNKKENSEIANIFPDELIITKKISPELRKKNESLLKLSIGEKDKLDLYEESISIDFISIIRNLFQVKEFYKPLGSNTLKQIGLELNLKFQEGEHPLELEFL